MATARFYFLEMNTRIQVEHPVTECVTGVDLVRLQFQVAQGRPLPFAQGDVALRGHAIEARLYAEDPAADFLPSIGTLAAWRPAKGEGVRVDAGVEAGSAVTPFYDSMLAKIIAFGETREEARLRLVRALEGAFVAGVATNRDFVLEALRRPAFVEGRATTAFVGDAPFARAAPSRNAIALAALLIVSRGAPPSPTAGWRAAPLRLEVDGDGPPRFRAAPRTRKRSSRSTARTSPFSASNSATAKRASRSMASFPARSSPGTATISGSTSRANAGASPIALTRRRAPRTPTRTALCARRSAASSSLSKPRRATRFGAARRWRRSKR